MLHYIYFDRQATCNGPDMPARLKISLHSVDQPEHEVSIGTEYSSNSRWGRYAKWAPEPVDIESGSYHRSLKQGAYELLDFHRDVQKALGLRPVTSLAFDYQDLVDGAFEPATRRLVVASSLDSYGNVTLGENGWPSDVEDYRYRLRFVTYRQGHNPEAAPQLREAVDAKNSFAALQFGMARMLKAKVRLISALRTADGHGQTIGKVINDRAEKRRSQGGDLWVSESVHKVLGSSHLPSLLFDGVAWFQHLNSALGLPTQWSYNFDYLERDGMIHRLVFNWPRNRSLGKAGGWSNDETVWSIGFKKFHKNSNPMVAPVSPEAESQVMAESALIYAIKTMYEAKFRLISAMRLPEHADVGRVIDERTEAREQAAAQKHSQAAV